jgi:hypothetical protein
MIAIVSSMCLLLDAAAGAARDLFRFGQSNGCAVLRRPAPAIPWRSVILCFVGITVGSAVAQAQGTGEHTVEQSASKGKRLASFLAGAATGLGAHEGAHVAADLAFGERPGIRKVDFHGIPFFAITHRTGLPARREFTISSAGFWMQHVTNEWLLSRRPTLRQDRAPFLKGLFAFNVLASVAYAGTAFAKTGPAERDTRGMAASARIDEGWIGGLVLAPAVLDGWRFHHPQARWAVWTSRAVKVGMVLLVVR